MGFEGKCVLGLLVGFGGASTFEAADGFSFANCNRMTSGVFNRFRAYLHLCRCVLCDKIVREEALPAVEYALPITILIHVVSD